MKLHRLLGIGCLFVATVVTAAGSMATTTRVGTK
jgi:hypothetical protein